MEGRASRRSSRAGTPGPPLDRWTLSGFLTSNRITMKSNRLALVLTLFLTLWIAPAYAANKVSAAINGLQTSVNKQQQDRAGQVDQISGQIQALNDTMDELKVRLAKLSKQFEDMQTAQQSMAAQQTQAQQQAQAIAQAPPPDVLYNNALRDYNGGKNDLAIQGFDDYIKFYPNTDLAGNAYFYLAEIQFKAGDYKKAVANYDLVLQNFPSGNKAAAAQLKKGYALLELGKEDEGTQELKHVIQRYPRTNEAVQARERLRKVAPAPKSR